MSTGFLYVLINPTIPGLAKIGKTTRDPSIRVAELSSATGVASPFILAFQQPVTDCDSAEIWVHNELTLKGYRHADNREFFNAALHEIIPILSQAATLLFENNSVKIDEVESEPNSEYLADKLYELACQYENGTNNILINKVKALDFYEQAAALGHILACSEAAWRYEHGPDLDGGPKRDKEKALSYLNKAVQLGSWTSEAEIAGLFARAEQPTAAQEHWSIFFLSACKKIEEIDSYLDNTPETYRQTLADIGLYGWKYCEAVALNELKDCVSDSMLLIAAPYIRTYIDKYISRFTNHPNARLARDMTNRLQAARNHLDSVKE
jgi:hypothetical protein